MSNGGAEILNGHEQITESIPTQRFEDFGVNRRPTKWICPDCKTELHTKRSGLFGTLGMLFFYECETGHKWTHKLISNAWFRDVEIVAE